MMELANCFCPNPKCNDHGIREHGNMTTSTRYGGNPKRGCTTDKY